MSKIIQILLFSVFIIGCKTDAKQVDAILSSKVTEDNAPFSEDGLLDTMEQIEKKRYKGEGQHKYDPTQTLYFSHAFIYKYESGGEAGEFWIYHNPENHQLLFVPEDPMVEFVVSDPLGNYYFFGKDGHGTKTVNSQLVEWVANPNLYSENVTYPISDRYVSIIPTGKIKVLDEGSAVDGKSIQGIQYKWKFSKVEGRQTTYVTEMIPVNFYQVYGFNRLEGDIHLPIIDLDFIGIFGKNQAVIHLESENLRLELIAYQFNPTFVEAADYEYFVQLSDDCWKKGHLPLLRTK